MEHYHVKKPRHRKERRAPGYRKIVGKEKQVRNDGEIFLKKKIRKNQQNRYRRIRIS